MIELSELKAKLKGVSDKSDAFQKSIELIIDYYTKNLKVSREEVAILLTNKDKSMLSFAAPEYLVNAGMIPVNSTDAIASTIFRTGNPFIDNSFHLKKHLSIFELIKTPDEEILPIWKMIAVLIADKNEKYGVLEISIRAKDQFSIDRNFTAKDLQFLESTVAEITPYVKKALPEDFLGSLL
jgi:hypothetical protein